MSRVVLVLTIALFAGAALSLALLFRVWRLRHTGRNGIFAAPPRTE